MHSIAKCIIFEYNLKQNKDYKINLKQNKMKLREKLIQELISKSCFTKKELKDESTEDLKILKRFTLNEKPIPRFIEDF